MSAKKSWDVERRGAKQSAPARAGTKRVEMTRRQTTSQAPAPARPARTVAPRPKVEKTGRLRERRREARKLTLIVWGIALLILTGILLYVLWLPAFRVSAVVAEGPDPEGIERATKETLVGTHLFILPKNSIFFIPEREIRAHILETFPAVQAVSISATGLTSLKIGATIRASSFTWCGESVELPAPTCYEADAEGLVFRETVIPEPTASTTASSSATTTNGLFAKKAEPSSESSLLVYGPLEGAEMGPIRSHVTYASALPGALKFIKGMRTLGADIRSVTLRDDEIDLHTRAGTRITYVIGEEGQAAILASTAFPTINVNDGSIDYVDLRFDNKVYLKRTGE